MIQPLNPAMEATFLPPVMEARRWLEGVVFPEGRPLINVSQAAPVDPPPLALRQEIARAALEDPAEVLRAFYDLAQARGLALIVDETYRDFDSRTGAPHDLFADPDWAGTLIQLYSFSKAYRLTGHRVGAITASAARLAQVEKFLDTVAICPSQLGQIAALWGMRNLGPWVAGERLEILARRAAMVQGFARLEGWRLLGCGAYFAYVEHPHPLPSPAFARALVREAGVLLLPGTMFMPAEDPAGARQLRIAFANVDAAGIGALFDRLERLAF